MSKRDRLMTKVLFFVILFTGLCWPEAGDAFEPWDGKAITVLNVRKSPELDSQAIGWLDKGQKITVNDEQKLWYKIIFEIEEKRYRVGWVYRRYIQRISSEKMEISSALAKVRAGIAVEGLREKIPLNASASGRRLPDEIKKELNKASTPAAPHVVKERAREVAQTKPPAPATTLVVKELTRAASQTKPPAPKMAVSTSPAPALVARERAREAAQTKPPAPKMEVSTSPPPPVSPAVSKRVDTLARTIVPVVQNIQQEPPVSPPKKSLADTQELKELAKLALRLLSVVLSCLAILFSYKAIKLAKISHDTAMQLQRNLQIWQQRENGQMS